MYAHHSNCVQSYSQTYFNLNLVVVTNLKQAWPSPFASHVRHGRRHQVLQTTSFFDQDVGESQKPRALVINTWTLLRKDRSTAILRIDEPPGWRTFFVVLNSQRLFCISMLVLVSRTARPSQFAMAMRTRLAGYLNISKYKICVYHAAYALETLQEPGLVYNTNLQIHHQRRCTVRPQHPGPWRGYIPPGIVWIKSAHYHKAGNEYTDQEERAEEIHEYITHA